MKLKFLFLLWNCMDKGHYYVEWSDWWSMRMTLKNCDDNERRYCFPNELLVKYDACEKVAEVLY